MPESLYIAVDLGAGSGRVFLAGVASGELLLEEIRRFHYPASESDGHLRWDFAHIFGEIKAGLRQAGQQARSLGRRIQSIGVDSWGVDYGLVDAEGKLVENPVCYRDERTRGGMMEQVCARIPRADLFARTGIQFQPFNTLFQLFAHAQEKGGVPAQAVRLLLIPDLVNFFLTGRAVTEYTNATTTQMLNAESRTWDAELLFRLELPTKLLTGIVLAGTPIAPVRRALADELGLEEVQVVATATHDTASAVAGTPLADNWAYISSGTWSLVGVEHSHPLINAEVARHNFTNEGGAFDTFRFLKNVMGLWILESCRREWSEQGLEIDYASLLRQVAARADYPALIFPDDARFFNPPSMSDAIAEQLVESGQQVPVDPVTTAKVILDSLALRYASVLKTIELLTGRKLSGVHIVGGGSRNDYLNQMTANAANLNVATGPVEATVTGNMLIQAIAAKRFTALSDARQHVARNIEMEKFTPRSSPVLAEAMRRYAGIEARYAN